MGKGNNRRGNKEIKKPKQEKPKAPVFAGAGIINSVLPGQKKNK
ncbi:hypothetical protein [Palleronia sp.]